MNGLKPILLVEDSPDDQTLIIRSLKKSNIQNPVLIANDGLEGLDYLLGTGDRTDAGPLEPVVVLLDMNMPRLNGLDVLERIRTHAPTKYVPVVILTSSDEEQDVINSYKRGANSYVRKPVDFQDFADAVGKLGLYWVLRNEPPPNLRPE